MGDTEQKPGAKPDTTGQTPDQQGQAPDGAKPADFESWLKTQDVVTQSLITSRFTKLEGALKSERETAKTLEKQVKELAKRADQGSELQTHLEKLGGDLAEERKRLTFYDAAQKAGASDLELAYLAAKRDGVLRDDGSADMDRLKAARPSLFPAVKPALPNVHAGSGTGGAPPTLTGAALMNAKIRKAAGYG